MSGASSSTKAVLGAKLGMALDDLVEQEDDRSMPSRAVMNSAILFKVLLSSWSSKSCFALLFCRGGRIDQNSHAFERCSIRDFQASARLGENRTCTLCLVREENNTLSTQAIDRIYRRNPQKIKTTFCKFFKEGRCQRGEDA